MRRLGVVATVGLLAVGLSGCGTSSAEEAKIGSESFDVSKVKTDDAIAAMVPSDLKGRGVLRNLASTDYAPAEYRSAEDDQTPVGYDIDMVRAIAKVMGLKDGITEHADFESLLPKIGTQADIGVSSFTINSERTANYDMISYVLVGSQFATAAENPNNFDPKDVCGRTIGVQTGTYQETDELPAMSKACTDAGRSAVQIMRHKLQTEISPKVASGQYDATFADSPVIGYTSKLSEGKIQPIGDVTEPAKQGIVVPQNMPELSKAIEAAVQKLMDDGTLKEILAHYGCADSMLSKAQIFRNGEE